MSLVTWLIGIALLLSFLGILLWWIRAVPLAVIVVAVVVLVIYDFAQTLRSGRPS